MTPQAPPTRRRRIGEVLVAQGVLTEERLESLLAEQLAAAPGTRTRLGQLVVARGDATERQVAQALAGALGLPLVDLARAVVPADVARLVPRATAERHGLLVVAREPGPSGPVVTVATSDPTDVVALDDVRLLTAAAEVRLVVVPDSQLREATARAWGTDAQDVAAGLAVTGAAEEEGEDAGSAVDDAPVVRLLDSLLADAVRQRASDVHVEPQASAVRVRFRVDGLLRDVMTVPRTAGPALVSRVKVVSGLDIAERRRPQDGRTRLAVDGRRVDARVSTLPSLHGEKVVVRLLATSDDVQALDRVGLEPDQLAELRHALAQPQGLVLLTGPTGSGKTTTLYAGLGEVDAVERNVVTLEDPVEIAVPGVVQVPVQPKAGLTFAAGLRSVLRQDPDVVLVGEVRDAETAGLVLEAAMTGHLVLSTLHTNDAVSAVTRLVDLGVEPFLVGSSLSLVVAQRLLRRPCPDCVGPAPAPDERTRQLLGLADEDLAAATLREGAGCGQCGGTGYRGRLGVHEVLPVTAPLRQVLLSDPSERAVAAAARAAGLLSLRAVALRKALRGETTLAEVLRVTPVDDHEGAARCRSCGTRLGEDMVCCPRCGTDATAHRCTGCSRALEADWRVCPWCRTAREGRPLLVAHAS